MTWDWEVGRSEEPARLSTYGEIPRDLDGSYLLFEQAVGEHAGEAVHVLRIGSGQVRLYRDLSRLDGGEVSPGGAVHAARDEDPEVTRAARSAPDRDGPSAYWIRSSAACARGQLADLLFPVIHVGPWGSDFRYVYALGRSGDPDKQTLLRRDLQTGEQTAVALGFGRHAAGPTFVPASSPARHEEDGYLLTLVYDAVRHQSDLLIFHAAGLARAPVASARLPSAIRSARPGSWVPTSVRANAR